MSRSNPTKLPRRYARSTQLVFGEGLEDKPLLKHLRSLYARDVGIYSKVDCGTGGSPKDIAEAAKRRAGGCKVILVVDGDKPKQEYDEMQRVIDGSSNMDAIIIKPCTEALLLAILNEGKWPNLSSSKSKSEFERKYIDERKRREQEAYAKILSKDLLDRMRKKIPDLDKLIKVFSGS
jgi:hypothetical protein